MELKYLKLNTLISIYHDKIGYSLTWTSEENIDLQLDILRLKGCWKIFTNKVWGVKFIQI